jgi:hypothetical protein
MADARWGQMVGHPKVRSIDESGSLMECLRARGMIACRQGAGCRCGYYLCPGMEVRLEPLWSD